MPILLISRGTMSGVSLLVNSLAGHIGYRTVSREDLVAKVNEHGQIANRIVENIGTATRAYEQFSQLRRSYLTLMRLALLEYIRDDNLIYHGYSGHLLVPALQHMLRIRITAPLPMRIQMTMERLGCSDHEAREHIVAADEQHGRWARFMYGRDIRDPNLYGLVVNLSQVQMHTVCRLLQCAADDPQFAAAPDTAHVVEQLLTATRIEAAVALDVRTSGFEVTAQVTDDQARIIGPWLDDPERAIVLGLAEAHAGGRRVAYEVGYAPALESQWAER